MFVLQRFFGEKRQGWRKGNGKVSVLSEFYFVQFVKIAYNRSECFTTRLVFHFWWPLSVFLFAYLSWKSEDGAEIWMFPLN